MQKHPPPPPISLYPWIWSPNLIMASLVKVWLSFSSGNSTFLKSLNIIPSHFTLLVQNDDISFNCLLEKNVGFFQEHSNVKKLFASVNLYSNISSSPSFHHSIILSLSLSSLLSESRNVFQAWRNRIVGAIFIEMNEIKKRLQLFSCFLEKTIWSSLSSF